MIQESCDMQSIKISKCKICKIINWRGKNHLSLLLFGKKTPSEYPKRVRTVSNLSKRKPTDAEINCKVLKYIFSNNK